MTHLKYYDDPYLKELQCTVTEVYQDGFCLDQTIVFGRSCGVKPDTGEFKALDVIYNIIGRREEGNKIIHLVEGDVPEIGIHGTLTINWEKRLSMMQLHTTLHILSSIIWKEYDVLVTGSDITPEKAKIDFDMERNFTKEELQSLEDRTNKIIVEGHSITSGVISPEEAKKVHGFIRSKTNIIPKGITELRYTKIEDVDMQADGGIHVRSTSEVGGIKITKQKNKGKGRRRLEVILSGRAP